jgi:hypothetical protein
MYSLENNKLCRIFEGINQVICVCFDGSKRIGNNCENNGIQQSILIA